VNFPVKGWVAVSANFLHDYGLDPAEYGTYKKLLGIKPFAVIGHTIFVYYFPEPGPS